MPLLATQLQHDFWRGRRKRSRKRWPKRWPKRAAASRTTDQQRASSKCSSRCAPLLSEWCGLSVDRCGLCDRRRGSCLYTWQYIGRCCVWRALGTGDLRSVLTPRIAFCHRQTRNTTEWHGLASGVSPHRPVSIKSPTGNYRHRQHLRRTAITMVPLLATQLQHDFWRGRRKRSRKRWPQRWPKRVAEARTTDPAVRI